MPVTGQWEAGLESQGSLRAGTGPHRQTFVRDSPGKNGPWQAYKAPGPWPLDRRVTLLDVKVDAHSLAWAPGPEQIFTITLEEVEGQGNLHHGSSQRLCPKRSDLKSRVSRGRSWPGHESSPQCVLVSSAGSMTNSCSCSQEPETLRMTVAGRPWDNPSGWPR